MSDKGNDLISRCKLFNALAPVQTLGEAYGVIQGMDTVDAVPVRHGRWIRVYSRPGVFKYLGWTCDQCGQRTGNEYAPQWYKFCPNCGARMDGKGNGNETD